MTLRGVVVITIQFSGLELRFLQDKDGTQGRLDLFEMVVQPKARMPVAHYHDAWDETVYGLHGTTTWRLSGTDVGVSPGESIFIRRGVVHGFRNDGNSEATCLCILTPGVLGPEYFQEMAALFAVGAPPNPETMKTVMLAHGLIPAPAP